jgi:hypothetical protein
MASLPQKHRGSSAPFPGAFDPKPGPGRALDLEKDRRGRRGTGLFSCDRMKKRLGGYELSTKREKIRVPYALHTRAASVLETDLRGSEL